MKLFSPELAKTQNKTIKTEEEARIFVKTFDQQAKDKILSGEKGLLCLLHKTRDLLKVKDPGFRFQELANNPEFMLDIKHERSESFHRGSKEMSSCEIVASLKHVLTEHKEILEKLQEFFSRKALVDLGAGASENDYTIAEMLGSASYTAVEPYYFTRLSINLVSEDKYCHKLPFSIINTDALSFLKRLEDNSTCIFSSGTDSFMVQDKEYAKRVSLEIARVIGSDNAFLGNTTVFTASDIPHQNINIWSNEKPRFFRDAYLFHKSLKNE